MPENIVDFSYPYILRSTLQQTTEGLLYQPPSMFPGGLAGRTSDFMGLTVKRFELHNRSGGSISVGLGYRIANKYWRAGFWTDATTAYGDDTTDAQDVSADAADFPMETATTNNDGFVILSLVPFDAVSLRVITAGVDGAAAADHAVRYSNYAGTGWTALDTASTYTDQFTNTNTIYAAGALEFVWKAPVNWGKVVSIGDIPAGYYALNVRATTAPDTTAAVASVIEIFRFPVLTEGLGDNGVYGPPDFIQPWSREADALVAYFSTANAGNKIYAEVKAGG